MPDNGFEQDGKIPSAAGLFLREYIRSFRSTASVTPSSRYLTAALCAPIDFGAARVIAEFGPGTGAVTNGILRRMRPDATLIAIDRNAAFIEHLKRASKDRRLLLVHGSADELGRIAREAGRERVDAVVSSLGLTSMDNPTRHSIYDQVRDCLRRGGVLTQYQYLTSAAGCKIGSSFNERKFLESYFGKIGTKWVFINFPPARVFTCRKA